MFSRSSEILKKKNHKTQLIQKARGTIMFFFQRHKR